MSDYPVDHICVRPDHDIILIDTSYFVFYRYYASYNWYMMHNESGFGQNESASAKDDVKDLLNDAVFMEKYDKMFEKTLVDVFKKYKASEWKDVFWIFDSPREHIWRFDLFKDYKASRDDVYKRQRFNLGIFKYTYDTLLPRLREKYGFQQLGVSRLEADDVISIIHGAVRRVNKDNSINNKITIITNDNDYIQLKCDGDHTRIMNLQGKDITERVNMPPETYLRVKIIMGDKSDCIPSIMKKVGPKTAQKLVEHPEQLEALFVKHPAAKVQYDINKRLIDMSCIPDEYKKEVLSLLKGLS